MLTTEESPDGDRRDLRESAAALPFDGRPAEQALRSQTVRVLPPSSAPGEWTVLAPVLARVGRHDDAVRAYRNVISYGGDTAERRADLGDRASYR